MFDHIKKSYSVNPEIGKEILFEGKRKGVIVKDLGAYIGVNFYDKKNTDVEPLHPTYEIEYLNTDGKIRPLTKGQIKYADFKNADWFSGTFSEWLGIKKEKA